MTKIEREFIDVPRDFRIACEGFGIMVPSFLQLMIRRVSFIHLFTEDDSEQSLATRAFAVAADVLKEHPDLRMNYSLANQATPSIPLLQKLMKLATNRSYSGRLKRERAAKLVEKLFAIARQAMDFKPYIFYDEETKITLTKDFMMLALINQYQPILLINAMMRGVSLADLHARVHLGAIEHNPALGFYLRVQHGYGELVDRQHINTIGFKNFIADLQEFAVRFFPVRDLTQRTELYRARLEENFQQINNVFDDE